MFIENKNIRTKIHTHVCEFHKKNPGKKFPGEKYGQSCGCSTAYIGEVIDDIRKPEICEEKNV